MQHTHCVVPNTSSFNGLAIEKISDEIKDAVFYGSEDQCMRFHSRYTFEKPYFQDEKILAIRSELDEYDSIETISQPYKIKKP